MSTRSTSKSRRWLRRRGRLLIAGVVAVLAVAAVPAAWSAFNDVPPGHPFYADVNAIQGAGITSGCGSGNFCPEDNITRQAEAAFVHRAGGRVDTDFQGPKSVPATGTVDLAVVTLVIGGVSGQTQFVKLGGNGTTYIQSVTGCPCQTRIKISQDGVGDIGEYTYTNNTFVGTSGFGLDATGVNAVVAVPTNTTRTFRLRAEKWDGTGTVSAFGDLTAITAPFGATGGNTLSVQKSGANSGNGVSNASG